MKFPGQRKSKHYFPVNAGNRFNRESLTFGHVNTYVTGLDQSLVDIIAHVDDSVLERFGLTKGSSHILKSEQTGREIYQMLLSDHLVEGEYAGGTIGNTLHNYSVLADDVSYQFGVISDTILVGTSAYHFLCNTSSRVDLTHLQPVPGPIGRAFVLVTPDGERTFAISPGHMDNLTPEFIPAELVAGGAMLLLSAYTMSRPESPVYAASMRAARIAHDSGVPVVLSVGSKTLAQKCRASLTDFIDRYVTVLAMNEEEATVLTGQRDPLLASDAMLDRVDMVLLTAGPEGLYLSGYSDKDLLRATTNPLRSAAISDFNRHEFSRPMLRSDCREPCRVYSHIDPYMGGPDTIANTNGAGDGALAAITHDMAANAFHRKVLPTSGKQVRPWLSYSSFSQMCKYANRVSYQVLAQSSPRLSRGLPEREDSLEEAYWDR